MFCITGTSAQEDQWTGNATNLSKGNLRVNSSGRYLEYSDGTPFLYMGDTAWELISRLNDKETELYLENRREKGFTVIQTVILDELDDMDVGIVAIGDRLEDSILATMNLKELGVPYVIVKAKNKRFKVVLEKIGADYVVRPEKEMGEKVARTLLRKNIKDLIELDEENCIVEMKVPQAWVGKTLSQLDLRKLYSINVLGKRNPHTHKLEVPVDPNLEIELNDTFLVLAQTDEIEKYDYLL